MATMTMMKTKECVRESRFRTTTQRSSRTVPSIFGELRTERWATKLELRQKVRSLQQEIEECRQVIMKARREVFEEGFRLVTQHGTDKDPRVVMDITLVEENLRRGNISRLEFLFLKERIDIQLTVKVRIDVLVEKLANAKEEIRILEDKEEKERVEKEKEKEKERSRRMPDSPPPAYRSNPLIQQFFVTDERRPARPAGNNRNRSNANESDKNAGIGAGSEIPNQRPVQTTGAEQSRNPRNEGDEVVDQQPTKTFRSSPNPNNTSGNCDDPNGQPRQQQASGVGSSSIYPNLAFQQDTSADEGVRARATKARAETSEDDKKNECCLIFVLTECFLFVYDCF